VKDLEGKRRYPAVLGLLKKGLTNGGTVSIILATGPTLDVGQNEVIAQQSQLNTSFRKVEGSGPVKP